MCSSTKELPPKNDPISIMKLDFQKIGEQSFRALQTLHKGTFVEKIWLVNADYHDYGSVMKREGF